jgi:hypothetical protein
MIGFSRALGLMWLSEARGLDQLPADKRPSQITRRQKVARSENIFFLGAPVKFSKPNVFTADNPRD